MRAFLITTLCLAACTSIDEGVEAYEPASKQPADDADETDAVDGEDDGFAPPADLGSDGTAVASEEVALELSLADLLTGAPVSDMALESQIDDTTTDEAGDAVIFVEDGETYAILGSAEGYHDHLWVGAVDSGPEWSPAIHTSMVSLEGSAAIAGMLGMELDPERGIVAITVVDGDGVSLAGATVDVDAEYDLALVADSSSPAGFSAGRTTLDGSAGWVVFLNVEPGDMKLEIDRPKVAPAGSKVKSKCAYGYSYSRAKRTTAREDSVTNTLVACR